MNRLVLSLSALAVCGLANSALASNLLGDIKYHLHVQNGVVAKNPDYSPALQFAYYAKDGDKNPCFTTPSVAPEQWRDDYTQGSCESIDHVVVTPVKQSDVNAFTGKLTEKLTYGEGQTNFNLTIVSDKQPVFNPDGTLKQTGTIKVKDGSGPWLRVSK